MSIVKHSRKTESKCNDTGESWAEEPQISKLDWKQAVSMLGSATASCWGCGEEPCGLEHEMEV